MNSRIDNESIEQIPASRLRNEKEIVKSWKGELNKPLVSISCITYNHRLYIEEAIVGFLRQKTTFPFEILIHDDASTDGTADVIEHYRELYPQIIKPLCQKENQYSKGVRPISKFNWSRAQGKYIAMCEGDDYWTDTNKLQTQIDFLEYNPDYVISGHDAVTILDDGSVLAKGYLPKTLKRDFFGRDLQEGKVSLPTVSWVFRNSFSSDVKEWNEVKNSDLFFMSLIGEYGKSHYHNDITPAVYRYHNGGVWSSVSSRAKAESLANTFLWIHLYYKRRNNTYLSGLYYKKFLGKLISMIGTKTILFEVLKRALFFKEIKVFVVKFLKR